MTAAASTTVAPQPQGETQGAEAGLRVRGLRKTYGETIALDSLDLDARPGEILGIAGPNGAGKSTLIKILADETRADSGEIFLDGVPWSPEEHRDRVAVVHQEPLLFPNLSVADNMLVGCEGTRVRRPRIHLAERDLMEDLGILGIAGKPLGAVPLAAQQRTEIGRALARS
ncbi:MAG: ATP-binding cassette domain-containing protein, partial [Chloroflexota bacterium]